MTETDPLMSKVSQYKIADEFGRLGVMQYRMADYRR